MFFHLTITTKKIEITDGYIFVDKFELSTDFTDEF